jgi:hypothetical protein
VETSPIDIVYRRFRQNSVISTLKMVITVDLGTTHVTDAPLISHQKLIKLAGDLYIQFMSVKMFYINSLQEE